MRVAVTIAALLLTACAPPAPPAAPPSTDPAAIASAPSATNPDAALLGANPIEGAWSLNGDGATTSAGYGVPESEWSLVIGCNEGTRRAFIFWSFELHPDQDTLLRIITETETVDFPARSFNEGLPAVNVEIDAADARLNALRTPQQRFAIDVAGQASVVPWDENIPRALENCA